jgi:3-deoxy-7-phosphoheptulonate synthase
MSNIFAGPCSLESYDQISLVAEKLDQLGLTYMRAPLFKPRTSPHSFQGLGVEGLNILLKVKAQYPTLKFVTEVCSEAQFESVKDHIQVIQIGSRNMQNFELLKHIGANISNEHEYVILKRGFAATFEEWINAASYLTLNGLPKEKLILCERGVRCAAGLNDVVLDFTSALKARNLGYSVMIDPSHGTKQRDMVLPLAQAALLMNFEFVMIETHPWPEKSVSDAHQALGLNEFEEFILKFNELNFTYSPPRALNPVVTLSTP